MADEQRRTGQSQMTAINEYLLANTPDDATEEEYNAFRDAVVANVFGNIEKGQKTSLPPSKAELIARNKVLAEKSAQPLAGEKFGLAEFGREFGLGLEQSPLRAGPMQVKQGFQKLASSRGTGGAALDETLGALSDINRGIGTTALPVVLPIALGAAPVPTLTALALGAGGSYAGRKGAEALGAGPGTTQFVEDVTGLVGGAGGAKAGPPVLALAKPRVKSAVKTLTSPQVLAPLARSAAVGTGAMLGGPGGAVAGGVIGEGLAQSIRSRAAAAARTARAAKATGPTTALSPEAQAAGITKFEPPTTRPVGRSADVAEDIILNPYAVEPGTGLIPAISPEAQAQILKAQGAPSALTFQGRAPRSDYETRIAQGMSPEEVLRTAPLPGEPIYGTNLNPTDAAGRPIGLASLEGRTFPKGTPTSAGQDIFADSPSSFADLMARYPADISRGAGTATPTSAAAASVTPEAAMAELAAYMRKQGIDPNAPVVDPHMANVSAGAGVGEVAEPAILLPSATAGVEHGMPNLSGARYGESFPKTIKIPSATADVDPRMPNVSGAGAAEAFPETIRIPGEPVVDYAWTPTSPARAAAADVAPPVPATPRTLAEVEAELAASPEYSPAARAETAALLAELEKRYPTSAKTGKRKKTGGKVAETIEDIETDAVNDVEAGKSAAEAMTRATARYEKEYGLSETRNAPRHGERQKAQILARYQKSVEAAEKARTK